MNPELQKQLAEMLAKLTNATEQGASWTAQQVPPLIHEKIVYGRVSETVQLALMIAAVAFCLYLCRFCIGKCRDDETIDSEGWAIGTGVTGVAVVMLCLAGAFQIKVTAMVWLAPRLYIIEWLHSLVTK